MKIISINDISKINLRFICEIIFEKLKRNGKNKKMKLAEMLQIVRNRCAQGLPKAGINTFFQIFYSIMNKLKQITVSR